MVEVRVAPSVTGGRAGAQLAVMKARVVVGVVAAWSVAAMGTVSVVEVRSADAMEVKSVLRAVWMVATG